MTLSKQSMENDSVKAVVIMNNATQKNVEPDPNDDGRHYTEKLAELTSHHSNDNKTHKRPMLQLSAMSIVNALDHRQATCVLQVGCRKRLRRPFSHILLVLQ